MLRKIRGLLLFLPVAALGAYMVYLSGLANFARVEIAVTGYDPRDLFAGHYMNLRLDWAKTDCKQFVDGNCPIADFKGFYNFYVKKEQATDLEKAVIKNDMKLIFSYQKGFEPMIVDLTVDGVSYKQYLEGLTR